MASNGQVVIDVTLDDGQVVSAIANIQNQFGDLQGAMLAIFNRIESVVTSFGSSLSQLGNDYSGLNDSISDVTRSSGSLSDVLGEIDRDIDRIDVDELSSDINELGTNITEVARNGSKAFKSLGTAIKGFGVISAGVGLASGALGFGLLAVVEASRELNTDLARLSANATTAGLSVEGLEKATLKVAAVSGELDSAVETVSNLAQTDFSENQLAEALDYVNGAAIRFSDTLNTEGIADGIQETFAVGEAAGSFAELLERSGVDLEKFNAGLVKAEKNGTETNFVLETLAKTGLKETYDAYLDNNQAIVEYNEAQVKSEVNAAKLAERLTPLATEFINVKNTISDVILGNKSLEEGFNEVSAVILDFGNRLLNLAQENLPKLIDAFVQRVPEFVKFGNDILNSIVTGLEQKLPDLIAKGLEIIQSLLSVVITNFPNVINTGVRVLTALVNGITSSLPQIESTALNLVTLLIKTIVANFPKVVTSGNDILNSIVTGLEQKLPDLIAKGLEIIQSLLSVVISNFPNVINTGVRVLTALVNGITSSLPKVVSTVLNLVTLLIKTIVANFPKVVTSGINLIVSLINGLLKALPQVVTFILTKFVPNVFRTFAAVDWRSVGRDIIGGIIKGLTSVVKNAYAAIKEIAGNLIKTARDVLDINSPSRVFEEIGLFTGKGLEVGLNSSSPNVNKAMKGILDGILDVSKSYEKEYQKLLTDNNKKELEKIKSNAAKIAKIESDIAKSKKGTTSKQLADLQKLRDDNNKLKLKNEQDEQKKFADFTQKAEKDYLAVIQKYIADKKSLDELSLVEEASILEQSIELFVVGSDQRIALQKEYQKAVETVNKEVISIQQDYLKEVNEIEKAYLDESKKLNDEYEKEFSDRVKTLTNFAGTFDEFNQELNVSGEGLILNLQNQVDALRNFRSQLLFLEERNVSPELINEISELGVKALPELVALNKLTDEQLSDYSDLYAEKSRQAREQATEELQLLATNTEIEIAKLNDASNQQLDQLAKDFDVRIKGLVSTTSSTLSTLKDVGLSAGQGLLDGLSQFESPLNKKAREIAEGIKRSIEDSLDINSPSRWARDFVVGNIAKGFENGVDKQEPAFESASTEIGNLLKTGITNPLRGIRPNLGINNSSPIVNNSQNVYNNSSGSQGETIIQPANVILDNKVVGEIMFNVVSKKQASAVSIAGLARGLQV